MEITPLQRIESAVHEAVSVHCNKKEVIIIAKRLSKIELDSCGDFSLINLDVDKHKVVPGDKLIQASRYAELQHKVLQMSMISPTYEEVENVLLKQAGVEGLRDRMKDLVSKFNFIEDPEERSLMEKEYAMLEFRTKFFFPSDFLIDVFTFATCQDISDIKLIVTEEILFNAAVLAKKGNCRISDILCEDGTWFPHNKSDIDIRGEIVHQERTKKK
jgi:hypothetical protein